MVTYSQYVLVSAASEEFWGGVKHDFRYELWARVLQLGSEPFVFSEQSV